MDDEAWRLPPEPPADGLSERERALTRRAWESLRDWLHDALDALRERTRERTEARVAELRGEIDRAVHAERFWERELETKLRRLEAFEVEFGSTRTAEESRALFREVRAQLASRENRWERILARLDELADDLPE